MPSRLCRVGGGDGGAVAGEEGVGLGGAERCQERAQAGAAEPVDQGIGAGERVVVGGAPDVDGRGERLQQPEVPGRVVAGGARRGGAGQPVRSRPGRSRSRASAGAPARRGCRASAPRGCRRARAWPSAPGSSAAWSGTHCSEALARITSNGPGSGQPAMSACSKRASGSRLRAAASMSGELSMPRVSAPG